MKRALGTYSRRGFLRQGLALGAGALVGPRLATASEQPPEVGKIRLVHAPTICFAPQYLAAELLHLEGFSDIEYVDMRTTKSITMLETGRADFTMGASPDVVAALDLGNGVLPLAGMHAGCYELFVNGRINAIKDLKNKSVVITNDDSTERLFISSIAAYVGVDPRDIHWINTASADEAMQYFTDGKADAFLGFAPQPQELRSRKIGRVILNTTNDRPWSQYFCCMVSARREFAEKFPVATKRALRAFLKAADLCTEEPERVARFLAAKGYEPRYKIGLEVLKSLPYTRWHQLNPEDTLRFHALRLHEFRDGQVEPAEAHRSGHRLAFPE